MKITKHIDIILCIAFLVFMGLLSLYKGRPVFGPLTYMYGDKMTDVQQAYILK